MGIESKENLELTRKLAIKINVIKRYEKELKVYEKEVDEQKEYISKLETQQACPHDIKKQYEVLGESNRMLPECRKRLDMAKGDLGEFLKLHAKDGGDLVELDRDQVSTAYALIA